MRRGGRGVAVLLAGFAMAGLKDGRVRADEQTAALGRAPVLTSDAAPQPPGDGPSAVSPDAGQGNPLASLPLSSLSATRDRPLFSPTRRPPAKETPPATAPSAAPAPPPPAAAAGPDVPPFEVVGTVLGGGADTAVLHNPTSNLITRLRRGQQQDGWRAVQIRSRQVILEKNGALATLDMVKPDVNSATLSLEPAPTSEPAARPINRRRD